MTTANKSAKAPAKTSSRRGKSAKISPENLYPDMENIRYTNGNIVSYMDTILFDYKPKVSPISKSKTKEAIEIVKFVVTEVLGWEPEDAPLHMTEDIMQKFRLYDYSEIFLAGESVPESVKRNPRYVFSFVYPELVSYNYRERYADLSAKASKWGKNELTAFDLGRKPDSWFNLFPDFIAENINVESTEGLYCKFSDGPAMKEKIKNCHLAPLLSFCFHPVQLLDAYLAYLEYVRAKSDDFDSDLYQDPLCYTSAMFRSVVTQYGKRLNSYKKVLEGGDELPEEDD